MRYFALFTAALVLPFVAAQNEAQFQSDLLAYIASVEQEPAFQSFAQAIATDNPAVLASLEAINPATITNVNQILSLLPPDYRSIFGQIYSGELSIASKDGIDIGALTSFGGEGGVGGAATTTAGAVATAAGSGSTLATVTAAGTTAANTSPAGTTPAATLGGSSGTAAGTVAGTTTKSAMGAQINGMVVGAVGAAVAGLAVLL